MNGIEENEKTRELERKKDFEDTEPFMFELKSKSLHRLSNYNKILLKNLIKIHPNLLFTTSEHKELINSVFKIMKISPLVQNECFEWSFKEKDFVLNFSSYFYISFTDINEYDSIIKPTQVKIIVFKDVLIVISNEKVFFIDYLFSELLNKDEIFPQRTKTSHDYEFIRTLTMKRCQFAFNRRISIDDCFNAFDLFYTIIRIVVQRYEQLVMDLINECKNCLNFSLEISYKELADYQIRISKAERNSIFLSDIVKPKIKTLAELENFFANDQVLCLALKALQVRIENLVKLIKSSRAILETGKILFRTCADDSVTRASFSSGELMKFYSGFTTIVVPLLFVHGLFSTNVKFPGSDQANYIPFCVIFGISCVWIFSFVIYFRRIQWF